MALIKCTECGQEISDKATACPNCGAPVNVSPSSKSKPEKKKGSCLKTILIGFAVIIAIGIIGSALGGDDESTSVPESSTSETSSTNNTADNTAESETEAPEENDNNIPTEYKSALQKANSYSEHMNMSKAAIYDQLISEYGEQFTEEAAQYAMDNLEADWNANALAKAQSYSDSMYMSKAAIYDQLISEYGEQFTEEEAQYAIDNIQADWNANALEKAKSYQQNMSMSPAAIYDQLISEYGEKFTAEEAQYAIDHLE